MYRFQPYRDLLLHIGPGIYRFLSHPIFADDPDEVFVLEGGEACTFKLQQLGSNRFYALKVLHPSYRGDHLPRLTAALAPFAALPGLASARRICLTRAVYPDLLAVFPDLDYAILMPWIDGPTWAGFLLDRRAEYSTSHARHLAAATARVLGNLEAHHLAHADIAGGNVVLTALNRQIELLDMEGMWLPGASPPKRKSRGSPGYQHKIALRKGQWCAEGDRFAGAILLVEMLIWCDPLVRVLVPAEATSLFHPDELQKTGTTLWQAARQALQATCPAALPLFDQAWTSKDMARCPALQTWAECLLEVEKMP